MRVFSLVLGKIAVDAAIAFAFFGSTCLPNDLCISPILPSTFQVQQN